MSQKLMKSVLIVILGVLFFQLYSQESSCFYNDKKAGGLIEWEHPAFLSELYAQWQSPQKSGCRP